MKMQIPKSNLLLGENSNRRKIDLLIVPVESLPGNYFCCGGSRSGGYNEPIAYSVLIHTAAREFVHGVHYRLARTNGRISPAIRFRIRTKRFAPVIEILRRRRMPRASVESPKSVPRLHLSRWNFHFQRATGPALISHLKCPHRVEAVLGLWNQSFRRRCHRCRRGRDVCSPEAARNGRPSPRGTGKCRRRVLVRALSSLCQRRVGVHEHTSYPTDHYHVGGRISGDVSSSSL